MDFRLRQLLRYKYSNSGTTISSVPPTCVPDVVLNSSKEIVENGFYILDLTAEGVSGVARV